MNQLIAPKRHPETVVMNALHKMYMVSHPLRISRYGAHTSLSSAERVDIIDTLTQTLGIALGILAQLKRGQQHLRNVSFLPLHHLFRKLVQTNIEYAEFLASSITDLGGYTEVATLYSLNDHCESNCFADCLLNIHQRAYRLQDSVTLLSNYHEHAVANKDSASNRYFEKCIHHSTRFLALIKGDLGDRDAG
jgi:DNA-binding ferritin-like protein